MKKTFSKQRKEKTNSISIVNNKSVCKPRRPTFRLKLARYSRAIQYDINYIYMISGKLIKNVPSLRIRRKHIFSSKYALLRTCARIVFDTPEILRIDLINSKRSADDIRVGIEHRRIILKFIVYVYRVRACCMTWRHSIKFDRYGVVVYTQHYYGKNIRKQRYR